MKKSRIFSALLVLALLSTCVIGGTFAKYTSTATGTDSAKVAKWSFLLNATEIGAAEPQTVTIELFKTILDTKDGNTETDVDETTYQLIAPGTCGEFDIEVQNTSEVTAKYSLSLVAYNDNNIPVEFSIDGGTTWVPYTSISSLNVTDSELAIGSTAEKKTIQWRWAFVGANSTNFTSTQTDAYDTALGVLARTSRPELKVDVTVVATQVD